MTRYDPSLRRAVATVAILNLAYFGVEFVVARAIGSVSLFADSVDFFEDGAVNILILLALGWSDRNRARAGMLMSAILLVPAVALLWTLWQKVDNQTPPDALRLTVTGGGALAINLFCAFLLAAYRHHSGSLSKAAFLSARNDAVANIGIIGAGLVTARFPSIWPDIVVGLAIAAMNLDAARAVWTAARAERRAAA